MVHITLNKISKQYQSNWVFNDLSCVITPESPTVVLGCNGSGKSTLLQLILSAITPTLGQIEYTRGSTRINPDQAFRLMAIAAPYIELIEEFTLEEMLNFHRRLKPCVHNLKAQEVMKICNLENSYYKCIRDFSSGIKQRVKLALAILSDTPVLLLDEPTSNLDHEGIDWYHDLVQKHHKNRTVVVSSNSLQHEYSFCTQVINLEEYKTIPSKDPSLLLY